MNSTANFINHLNEPTFCVRPDRTCHGPLYNSFSAWYRSLSRSAASFHFFFSSAEIDFHSFETILENVVTLAFLYICL